MLNPFEINDFLEGKLGHAVVLSVKGDDRVLRLERAADGTAIGLIPKSRLSITDPFDIVMALSDPVYGLMYEETPCYYVTKIRSRSNFHTTTSIAKCHLNWHDDQILVMVEST